MDVRKTPLDESLWFHKEPDPFTLITSEEAMSLASSVALKGTGAVHKNPRVGAVFVDKNHRFLAAAGHLSFGQEHAEINLIDKIRKLKLEGHLEGGSLYTTLEPCSHFGKTQPCVLALCKLPIKHVVYGAIDPNPLVAGRGIRHLEEHGITCSFSSDFAKKCEHLLEHFRWNLSNKTPFCAIKSALTVNGMAAHSGDQRAWITSERARDYAHFLRLSYEGILVGAETVILDNPSLNIRHPKITGRTPLRVVLDPHARALRSRPLREHNLLKNEASHTLWVCTEWDSRLRSEIENLGAQTLTLEKNQSLKDLLQILGETKDLASLLIEGGPSVWSSFLNESLVQKCYTFLAPKVFSSDALNFAKNLHCDFDLEFKTLTCLQDDLLIESQVLRRK